MGAGPHGPSQHAGVTYELTEARALTLTEVAATVAAVTGRLATSFDQVLRAQK